VIVSAMRSPVGASAALLLLLLEEKATLLLLIPVEKTKDLERVGWRAHFQAGRFVDPPFCLMNRDRWETILRLKAIQMKKG